MSNITLPHHTPLRLTDYGINVISEGVRRAISGAWDRAHKDTKTPNKKLALREIHIAVMKCVVGIVNYEH